MTPGEVQALVELFATVAALLVPVVVAYRLIESL